MLFLVMDSTAQDSSSCDIDQAIWDFYEKDIYNMAMRSVWALNEADTASVDIPQERIDLIAGQLAAIFNLEDLPQRDTIFDIYCIHDNSSFEQVYQEYLVKVDTNALWVQNWQDFEALTTNPFIDSLVTKYDITIKDFYYWSFGTFALIETEHLLNSTAFVNLLATDPAIEYAEVNAIIGNAHKIELDLQSGFAGWFGDYTFYYEWNDCFDGCDNYRSWRFNVNFDCSVQYLGAQDWGFFGLEPLPEPVNCNISTGLKKELEQVQIKQFPNPVLDFAHFTWDPTINFESLSIYNPMGQVLYTLEISNAYDLRIHMEAHPPGVYHYRLANGLQQYASGSFVKM